MIKTAKTLSVALFLMAPTFSVGQAYFTDSGHAQFTSSVPLHTFTGESENLVGRINLADSTVDFYVDLTTLETGIGKRDKDMRETLETDEYPFAEFFGKLVTPLDPEADVPQEVVVRGEFKIHGVSREVEIPGTITPEAEGLHVEANWELRLADYEIEPPSLLIVRVDQIQKLRIQVTLPPEQ
jgi:polyisoprenoid-binding protein YceI